MAKDRYQKTKDTYHSLGLKYLQNIAPAKPAGIDDFIKLIPKAGHILDVGCAGGRDSKYFVSKGFQVTGIDVVNKFLSQARKDVPQASFKNMDLLDLKFKPESFNAVWAVAVLLHLKRKDVPKALKNFYQVLKPGGILQIRVKQGQGLEYKKEKLSQGQSRVFTYFLEPEIKDLIKKAGFKIKSTTIFSDELNRSFVKWISITALK